MALLSKPPKRRKNRLGTFDKQKEEAAALYISMKGVNKREKAIRAPRDLNRKDRVKGIKSLLVIIPVVMLIIAAGGLWLAYQEFVKLNPPDYPTASDYEPPSTSMTEEDLALAREKDLRLLLPVNVKNPLPEDFTVHLAEYGGIQCDETMIPSLKKMMEDAAAAGYPLTLTQGYVEPGRQQQLYEETVTRLMEEKRYSRVKAEAEAEKSVPPAGKSEYQTGLNINVSADGQGEFTGSGAYKWITSNCVEYGFVLRYPEAMESETGHSFDPTQFRYVGEQHAKKMRTLNLSLNEYYPYVLGKS